MIPEIEALVKSNPNQLSVEEYTLIYNKVKELSPCNMLVFGVGNDSALWYVYNKGYTAFLEDNHCWIDKIRPYVPYIYACSYNKDDMFCDRVIHAINWNIIFVDGPDARHNKEARNPSIKAAAQLAKSGCHVFIHDCDRECEALACDTYFKATDLVETVGKLRHYKVGGLE